MATGQEVADFLGRGDDAQLVALAEAQMPFLTELARAYTRGQGFAPDGRPYSDVNAVLVMAAARLVTNPSQLAVESGDGYRAEGGFKGWTLVETMVLNGYRRRAA